MKNRLSSYLKSAICLLLSWLLTTTRTAQAQPGATPLPANWQKVGSVWASPDQSAFKTTASAGSATPGQSIWVGTAGQPLELATATIDFQLTLDFIVTPGADVDVVVPSGQIEKLTAWPVTKAAGLWQSLTVNYRLEKPAMLEKMAINGVTVEEGKLLAAKPAEGIPAGLVGVRVRKGSVAVRNVVYKPYAAGPVRWPTGAAHLATPFLPVKTLPALRLWGKRC